MLPLDTTEVNSFMMIRQFHVVHSKADFIFIQNTPYTTHLGQDWSAIWASCTGVVHEIQLYIRKMLRAPPGMVFQCIVPSREMLQILYPGRQNLKHVCCVVFFVVFYWAAVKAYASFCFYASNLNSFLKSVEKPCRK